MSVEPAVEQSSQSARPLERAGRLGLVPIDQWHRCHACGATFAAREGLRGHLRFGRCRVRGDPLDEPGLLETELRRRVRERLFELMGGGP
jgi:hypothetical protein